MGEWLGLSGKLRLEPATTIFWLAEMPAFFMSTPNPTTCTRPNCVKPRAIVTIDGQRKRAKVCRRHLPRHLRPLADPIRKCQGTNLLGDPCRSRPLLPGRVIAEIAVSGDFCLVHEPLLQDEDGRGGGRAGFAHAGGSKRRPRKTELILKAIEEAAGDVVNELIDTALAAQKAVVVGNGPSAYIEHEPDLALRAAVGRDLLDRLMGKPRQTTEIIGGDASAREQKRTPKTPERARKVAEILSQSQAVRPAHDTGRKRAKPSEPARKPEEAS